MSNDCLISPKQFQLLEISPKLACQYNEQWHSLLPNIHYSNVVRLTPWATFGAYFQEICYAVGIWSAPIGRFKNRETYLELRRLAINEFAPKYTASWMLGAMIKQIKIKFPEIRTLVSYQDTEKHTGTIYKASNWTPAKITRGITWWMQGRDRNKPQTTAKKIRWEYYL